VLFVRETDDGLDVGAPGDVIAQPTDGSEAFVVTFERTGISAGLMRHAMTTRSGRFKSVFPSSFTYADLVEILPEGFEFMDAGHAH